MTESMTAIGLSCVYIAIPFGLRADKIETRHCARLNKQTKMTCIVRAIGSQIAMTCIVRTIRSQIAMMDRVLNLQMSWVRDYGVNFPPRHQ